MCVGGRQKESSRNAQKGQNGRVEVGHREGRNGCCHHCFQESSHVE